MRPPDCHPNEKYQGHGLCTKCYMKKWSSENLERKRKMDAEHYIKNREKRIKYASDWRKSNPTYNQEYKNTRYKKDPEYRLSVNLRNRLGIALKRTYKMGSAVRDLG